MDWKHLKLEEIVSHLNQNKVDLMVFTMSGFDYIMDYKSYSDTFINECIVNEKSNQRLINLIIETYKKHGYLIRKRDIGGLIKFFIYV